MNQNQRQYLSPILQVLIGAACLIVIIGGGYFAWSQYNRWQIVQRTYQAAETIKAMQDNALAEQKHLAAQKVEHDKNQMLCNEKVTQLRQFTLTGAASAPAKDKLVLDVKDCIKDGLIDEDAIRPLNLFK